MRLLCLYIGLAIALPAIPASASEPEFGITSEFLSVCESFATAEQAATNLLDAGWEEAGENFRDALAPDDLMKKVKKVRAFSVELENGGMWLAAVAEGRMGESKVAYCGITSVDDDPDGYRQDFEKATGYAPTSSAKNELENRNVYQTPDNRVYVMREIRIPDNGYFTYVRLAPLSAKGK